MSLWKLAKSAARLGRRIAERIRRTRQTLLRAIQSPFESLEDRVMLADHPLGNAFARFEGTLSASITVPFEVNLPANVLVPTRTGKTVVGFQVRAATGSPGLDPAAVTIRTRAGGTIAPMFQNGNVATGQSLVLAELVSGDYTVEVSSERGTSGQFFLDLLLIGDADGDRDVDRIDTALIRGIYGKRTGAAEFKPEADADLNGLIDSVDMAQHIKNIGALASNVSPLFLNAELDPTPPATLPNGTPLTNDPDSGVIGSTRPGVTVRFDSDGDGFDDGTAVADSLGKFSFPATLVPGLNTLKVQAVDAVGQTRQVDLPVFLDVALPQITLSLADASDTAPKGDNETTLANVMLEGVTEPNLFVRLNQTGATTTSDATGKYSFGGVALAIGLNSFTATARDAAGNEATAALVVTRIQPPSGLFLIEETNFRVFHQQQITVPAEKSYLSFTYEDLFFDTGSSLINDAFEAALLDGDGNPLVHVIRGRRDAFFNISEGEGVAAGPNTVVNGNTVKVDLSHIPAGTPATLELRLVNNDTDESTQVRIKDIKVEAGDLGTPAAAIVADDDVSAAALASVLPFDLLDDVTASTNPAYRRTSFNDNGDTIFAGLQISNDGTFDIGGPILVAVANVSDPLVRVLDADGVTPDGLPFYDISHLIPGALFDPGETSGEQVLAFLNPSGQRFTYDLVVLGRLNHAPEFTTTADPLALVGKPYTYDSDAEDVDQDVLKFSLLAGPDGMVVDPATGLTTWTPTAADLGSVPVTLLVEDGRGGTDVQTFVLSVRDNVPNRPPVFISEPVVDARVGEAYVYDADAIDPDQDVLFYTLDTAPANMTINSSTGQIAWTPAIADIGQRAVIVRAEDGRGGVATQAYLIGIRGSATNGAPVFVTDPVTGFELPNAINPATGQVLPTLIDIDLESGQVYRTDVSLRVPDVVESGFADIVFVVDESGSMSGEHVWIQQMVRDLDAALLARGIGPNRYALVGYGGGGAREPGHVFPGGGQWTISLFDLTGKFMVKQDFTLSGDSLRFAVPVTGEYLAVVTAKDTATPPSYSFRFTAGPRGQTAPLTIGQNAQGTLELPGELDTFTFTLSQRSLLYFDSLTNNSAVNWTLNGPVGTLVSARAFSTAESGQGMLDLPAGDYRMTIGGAQGAPYEFRLLNLADATPVTFGATVSGTLTPGNSTQAYRFNAAPGDRIYIDSLLAVTSGLANWRLLDPFGGSLTSATSPGTDFDTRTIGVAGTYTLLIEGSIGTAAPVNYSFSVVKSLVEITPLVLGQRVDQTIALQGETDVHTFTLAQPTLAYFDSLFGTSNHNWTLQGASGTLVTARALNVSDPAQALLELPAGDYQLIVDAAGSTTGAYAFRLTALNQAAPVTPGVEFDGDLAVGNESDLYGFAGTAGDPIYIDVLGAVGLSGSYRLVSPYGVTVATAHLAADTNTLVLPLTGQYTFIVESTGTGTGTYRYNLLPVAAPVMPLTLGQVATGTLGKGQSDVHTFTLSQRSRLYFDSLLNLSTFNWTLQGPSGTVVNARAFNSQDRDLGLLDLPAGDYRLTVDATGENTGSYSFALSEVATAQVIAPDTAIAGSFTAKESYLYQFDAVAGARYFFDIVATSDAAGASWRLISPANVAIFAATSLADQTERALPLTGTYTLLLESTITNTGPDTYTFRIESRGNDVVTPPSGTPLALGDTVSQDISVGGEIDSYVFTLTDRVLAVFDSLTNSSTFQWTLSGPAGTHVSNRGFNSADSSGAVLDLRAGDYLLSVRGSTGTATGFYSFRLVNLAAATPLTPGTAVTGDLIPGRETDLYSFSATAGQRFYFDAISLTGGTVNWRLIDPFGANVFAPLSAATDVDTTTLAAAGVYTLLIEGATANAADVTYQFNIHQALFGTAPLTLGTTVSSTIATPGERQTYAFSLPETTQLYFDSRTNSSTVQWTFTGPAGTIASARNFSSGDLFGSTMVLPAGDYQIVVDATGANVPAYSFNLSRQSDALLVTPGSFSGTLDPGSRADLYRFTANSGDLFYFDGMAPSTSSVSWRLLDQFGGAIASGTANNDTETFEIPRNGNFLLAVDGAISAGAPLPYAFGLISVQYNTAPMTLGQEVSGTIGAQGERDLYTFTLPQRAFLHFDSRTNNANLTWTLTGPAGTAISARAMNAADGALAPLDLPAGDYTLTVDGATANTGPYAFALWDLGQATPITPGTPFAGKVNPGSENDLYRFTAAAGQRIYIDSLNTITGPTYRLIGPYGNVLVASTNLNADIDTMVLQHAGVYTLLIEGSISAAAPVSYQFNVQDVSIVQTAMTPGDTVSATIGVAGESDEYTFTLSQQTLLYFDSLTNNANLKWTLSSPPTGAIVSARAFNSADGSNAPLDLAPGTYTITVDATLANTGAYSFRLLPLSQATALVPGTTVVDQLDPGAQTDLRSFTAAAGDRFYFDTISSAGGTAAWRIFDPYGATFASGGNLPSDVELPAVTIPGIYTLAIEGAIANTAVVDYSFSLIKSVTDESALILGTRADGMIGSPGDRDVYTFNLPARSLVYFDSLTNSALLNWTLEGPSGTVISARNFNTTDNSLGALNLHPGAYILTVDAIAALTGAYSFRLSLLSSATAVTPDTPFVTTLTHPNETNAFRFSANAGDKFLFDVVSASDTGGTGYRLINPVGAQLLSASSLMDSTEQTLAVGGTYTLLVESSNANIGLDTYTFNVVSRGNTPPTTPTGTPLTLGVAAGGTLVTANQTDVYTFTLASPALGYFDGRNNSGNIQWSLSGPGGALVTNRGFSTNDSTLGVLDLPAGSYVLSVRGAVANLGAYSFTFSDLLAPSGDVQTISRGDVVQGIIPARGSAAFRFSANAGDLIYLDAISFTGGASSWRLIDPFGQNAFAPVSPVDRETFALAASGSYTLLVEAASNATLDTTYQFSVLPVSYIQTAMSLDQRIDGTIGVQGERDIYTFSLPQRTRAYFDALISSANFNWTLEGPAGTYVSARAFSAADTTAPLLDLHAGNYRLTVDGATSTTGAYAFRLLNIAAQPAASTTADNDAAMTSGFQSDFWRAFGEAGGDLLFRMGSGNAFGNADQIATLAKDLQTSGGTEDGYDGIDEALSQLTFRPGAAVNVVLITDEDRDNINPSLNFASILADLGANRAVLNAVIDTTLRSGAGATALGVDSEKNSFVADGAGGFVVAPNGTATNNTLQTDYGNMAWATKGATWDLTQLRNGGLPAVSFTKAFVEIKRTEIERQLRMDIVASDPSVGFINHTGVLSDLLAGDLAEFDVQFTGDGVAKSFDIQFVREGSGNVLGSIPVRITRGYFYAARAIDPDGDAVTYSLLQSPLGGAIDPATGKVTFRPQSAGQFEFLIRASDGKGGNADQLYTLTVTEGAPNAAPQITSTAPTVATANLPFVYEVKATDADQDPLAFSLTQFPNGMTIDAITGRITWTPGELQTGPSNVTVRVTDGRGGAAVQSFVVNVAADAANRAPAFVTTAPTEALVGETLRYDADAIDPDADQLVYDLPIAPAGMTIDSVTGQIAFHPVIGQEGVHPVAIRANDGRRGVVVQYFELRVIGENHAPFITSTAPSSATAGASYQYAVKAQDSDGDALVYSLTQSPTGMNINPATGLITFQPTDAQAGTHSVTVSVSDGRGGSAQQSYTLTVAPAGTANQAPTITSAPPMAIAVGNTYLYLVQASDPDGNPLTFSLAIKPAGMTIDAATGVIAWTPLTAQAGVHSVRVEVADGRGGLAFQEYQINATIPQINHAPTITSTPIGAVVANGLYSYNATATDPDGDAIAWEIASGPSGIGVDPILGTVRWSPTSDQIGSHVVLLRAMDSHGAQAAQQFSIRVTSVNRGPSITSIPGTEAFGNVLYTYALIATDPEGDALVYSLPVKPAGMSIDPATGVISWTPTPAQAGVVSVEVLVTDPSGAGAKQTYQIGVQATRPNQPPVIDSAPTFVAEVGKLYTYDASAFDPDGDAVTFSLLNPLSGMTIDPGTGIVLWTPIASQVGPRQIQVVASDPLGAKSSQKYSVTVIAANRAPTITSTAPLTKTAGALYRYDVKARDLDNDPLTYALTQAPAGMTIDALGRITWQTAPSDVGDHPVTVSVADGRGPATTQSFTLKINPDVTKPKVTIVIGVVPIPINTPVPIQAAVTDDVAVVDVTVTLDGTELPTNTNGQTTVTISDPGPHTITVVATDPSGNTTTTTRTVSVVDPSDTEAPDIALTTPAADAIVTAPVDVIGTASDSNLSFYTLSVAPTDGSQPFREIARGTQSVVNSKLGRFDPTLLANGSYTLRLLAADNGGHTIYLDRVIEVAGELKLGNFAITFSDMVVPVSGVPISAMRTYDTLQSGRKSEMGYGWNLEFRNADVRSSVPPQEDEFFASIGYYNPFTDGTRVYITVPGGQREAFTFEPEVNRLTQLLAGVGLPQSAYQYDPKFIADPGVTSKLTLTGATTMIRNSFGEYYSIGGTGLPFNPESDLFYAVYHLTTKDGRTYDIDAPTGKITQVRDRNGNKLTFSDSGVVSSEGPSIAIARDAQKRIVAITDPDGNLVKYGYDAAGDLVSVTDRENNVTRFEYRTDRPHYLAKVIDPLGRTGARVEYDSEGRISTIYNALGQPNSFDYDPDASSYTSFDPLGNATTFVYDNRGNTLVQRDAEGGVMTFTYDANNNPLTETDALGNTTTYAYDADGDVTSVKDARGNVTRFTYNAAGDQLTLVDALGNVTKRTYDSKGNPTTVTDPLGNVTKYVANASGTPASMTDAEGNLTSFNFTGNKLTSFADPTGGSTTSTFDSSGRPLTVSRVVTTPSGPRTLVTTYVYDRNGELHHVEDAEGGMTMHEHDAAGNHTAVVDALGRRTEFEYDDAGRLTVTRYPDNTSTTNVYDAAGRKAAFIDQLGRTTRYVYDKVNRLIETIYPDATPADLTDNPRTQVEYDLAGRKIADIDELGRRTEFAYDVAGNLLSVTDPLARITRFVYDALNRTAEIIDPAGRITRYVYDAASRKTQTIFPDNTSQKTTYDKAGRPISRTDQLGRVTQYVYDGLSRLTAVIDALSGRTEYAYDEMGNLISQKDPNGHVTSYEYDGLGRRTTTTLPLGHRSTAIYDAVGNITSTTDYNGDVVTYQYDLMNRLVTQIATDVTHSFTYTLNGLRQTATDSRGVTTYAYNLQDMLQSVTEPDGRAISYTYDAVGNRTSVTTPSGATTYTFDALNRMKTVSDSGGGLTTYAYDLPTGDLTQITLPNGVVQTFTHDLLGRMTALTHTAPGGAVLFGQTLTLDAVGNRTRVVENSGRIVDYTYDALNRLLSEQVTDATLGNQTVTYTYDPASNRLTKNDSVAGLTTYVYDDNDRLLTETIGGATTTYTYDDNGNTLTRATSATDRSEYTYDRLGRMIRAGETTIAGTKFVEYIYNAEGLRVAAIADPGLPAASETRYLYDRSFENAQLAEEYTPAGAMVASFVRGLNLISQLRDGNRSIFHADAVGSTRALSNALGLVTDTYLFDAFGNVIRSTGSTVNPHLFTGELRDALTGLDYLRARYMDSSTGRFVSRDPFAGIDMLPISKNPYIYAADNPLRYADPSGRFFDLVGFMAALSIQDILRGIDAVRHVTTFCNLVSMIFGIEQNLQMLRVAMLVAFGAMDLMDSPAFIKTGFVAASWEFPEPSAIKKAEVRYFESKGDNILDVSFDTRDVKKHKRFKTIQLVGKFGFNFNATKGTFSVAGGVNIDFYKLEGCGLEVLKLALAIRAGVEVGAGGVSGGGAVGIDITAFKVFKFNVPIFKGTNKGFEWFGGVLTY